MARMVKCVTKMRIKTFLAFNFQGFPDIEGDIGIHITQVCFFPPYLCVGFHGVSVSNFTISMKYWIQMYIKISSRNIRVRG